MEGGICKIKVKNMQASGFFCRIPFPDKKNMLKVLISTDFLINEEVINQCLYYAEQIHYKSNILEDAMECVEYEPNSEEIEWGQDLFMNYIMQVINE